MKLVGEAVLDTRTLLPMEYAFVPAAWLTVNTLEAMEIVVDVVDVNPV
jgi:hypothetical protein